MIMIYTTILFIIIFYFNYLNNNNKYLLQYNTILYLLALAPTTKLLGLHVSSFYNLQFARYLSLLMLPFALIYFIKNQSICRYANKIIITLFLLVITILIVTFLRTGNVQKTFLLNIEIFTVVLLYSLFIFSKYPTHANHLVKNFLLVITFFAAFLSLGTYLHLEPFYTGHQLFYNTYIGAKSLDTLFDFVKMYNRPYSIFAGANQFSMLASIALIFGYYFHRIKLITHIQLFFLLLSTGIILITSGSRTGMILYMLSLTFIYSQIKSVYSRIALPIIIILNILIIYLVSDRFISSFSSINTFFEILQEQRIGFWLLNWDYINADIMNFFLGYQEQIMIEGEGAHYESGYLQLLGIGGIIVTLLFLYLLKSFYFLKLLKEELILKKTILLFCFAEIFMGIFFELKWSVINGVLMGFILHKSYIYINIIHLEENSQ